MMSHVPTAPSLYAAPTLMVAQALLGGHLIVALPGLPRVVGRIVETEGYPPGDPAYAGWRSYHAQTGQVTRTARTQALFGPPGRAYLYVVYRRHWMLNLVTEEEGRVGAVLIRAAEIMEGTVAAQARRGAARTHRELANGPGKLTQAFRLDGQFNQHPVDGPPLWVEAAKGLEEPLLQAGETVAVSTRIGLRHGTDLPYRFHIEGHPCVTPGKTNPPLKP
ncbi:MAG: DNA-3-methyladenine glycosylase [Bacteroidota bacterium]